MTLTGYEQIRSHTMVSEVTYYENERIAEKVRDIIGCVVECGVRKGGMSAAMFQFLGTHRTYWLLDSFEGLPPAREIDGPAALRWQKDINSPAYFNNCKADITEAMEAMQTVGCHDFHIVKGWFNDTLPGFYPGPIALLRLDCDWYDSTMLCLDTLYGKVVGGGVIIFDDYTAWDGCRTAVDEFFGFNLIKREGETRYYVKDTGVEK